MTRRARLLLPAAFAALLLVLEVAGDRDGANPTANSTAVPRTSACACRHRPVCAAACRSRDRLISAAALELVRALGARRSQRSVCGMPGCTSGGNTAGSGSGSHHAEEKDDEKGSLHPAGEIFAITVRANILTVFLKLFLKLYSKLIIFNTTFDPRVRPFLVQVLIVLVLVLGGWVISGMARNTGCVWRVAAMLSVPCPVASRGTGPVAHQRPASPVAVVAARSRGTSRRRPGQAGSGQYPRAQPSARQTRDDPAAAPPPARPGARSLYRRARSRASRSLRGGRTTVLYSLAFSSIARPCARAVLRFPGLCSVRSNRVGKAALSRSSSTGA